MLTIAILGRPNVGKSTLFNRLVGRRRALVDNQPGVTRDRIEGTARLGSWQFRVVDTAGLDEGKPESLEGRLRRQSETALADADVGLFVFDARAGVTAVDSSVADWLRRQSRPIILVANKCEGMSYQAGAAEAFTLGLGDVVPVSAEHGTGIGDLLDALEPYLSAALEDSTPDNEDTLDEEEEDSGPLRLAIVGRPNVGKSSLINRLLGDERLLTGPEPGLTRDAVPVAWQWQDRRIELIDTAGLRRKARIDERIERMSTAASLDAVRRCHSVALVLDARSPLERQELTIANLAIDQGRSCVIALNKWDLVGDPQAALAAIRERINITLPQVRGITCLPLSALTGWHIDRLLPAVISADERWRRRIPTGVLNRRLEDLMQAHPPPMAQGRRIRIRYATQTASRPPRFVLFANKPGSLPKSYLRYLANGLRDGFDLDGVPLQITLRKGDNPYV